MAIDVLTKVFDHAQFDSYIHFRSVLTAPWATSIASERG